MAEAHKDVLAQFIMQHRADSQLVLHIIKDHIMENGAVGAVESLHQPLHLRRSPQHQEA
jgi:hypothetical protein